MTMEAHHVLEGSIFIIGKGAKVQFDTGTIGANLISAAIVTTQGIPCTEMKEPIKILRAMKGSRFPRHKECTIDLAVGKIQTIGKKMVVDTLAKYDTLIGMLFL